MNIRNHTRVLALGIASLAGLATAQTLRAPNDQLRTVRQLVVEAMDLGKDYRFRPNAFQMAEYRIRTAQIELRHFPSFRDHEVERIEDAMELILDKLDDHFLQDREKLEVLLDCGTTIVNIIDDLMDGRHERPRPPGRGIGRGINQREALDLVWSIERLTQREDFYQAADEARQLGAGLRPYRFDVDLRRAIAAAEQMADKLEDAFLTSFQKRALVRDYARVAREAIESSDAFDRDGFEPHPPRQPFPPRDDYRRTTVHCGSTDFQRQECRLDLNRGYIVDVRLIRQSSRARCDYGTGYGFTRDSVWTAHGCRGTFEVEISERGFGPNHPRNPRGDVIDIN